MNSPQLGPSYKKAISCGYQWLSGWWQLKDVWIFYPGSLGKMDSIWWLHIFQMGWFNHQLDNKEKPIDVDVKNKKQL